MFEKFTDRARRVMVLAQEEARLLGHDFIGTGHLFLALVHEPDSVAGEALASAGLTLEVVRQRVTNDMGEGAGNPSGPIPFTPDAKSVLEGALHAATRLGDEYIGTAHLLLSLLRQPDDVATRIVAELGSDPTELAQRAINARADHRERLPMGATRQGAVAQNLTPAALDVQRVVRAVASLQPLRSYHYLLALFHDPSSVAAKVLASLNIDRATVERCITEIGTAGTTDALPDDRVA